MAGSGAHLVRVEVKDRGGREGCGYARMIIVHNGISMPAFMTLAIVLPEVCG